jgi:predicted LPLAT superfamily acyltransferase
MTALLPPDARPGAAAAPVAAWAGTRERSNRLALRLMAWIAITAGRRASRWLLHPIALYFLLFGHDARRHSARYLSRVLGRPARWHERYDHIHRFACTVLDRVYLARGHLARFDVRQTGGELVDDAVREGHGAFLVGAHIGSFEVLHAIGAGRPGMRVAMAMYPDNARMIQEVLHTLAPGSRMDLIAIGRSGSTLAIRDWLEGGGLVGMLSDRHLGAEGSRTTAVSVPFLGVPATFSDGPLRLAQLLRQRVIFMVGLYCGGARYDVRFETLVDFRERVADPAERERQLQRALRDYVLRLESLVREQPSNWFNFFDFWREDTAH